MATLTSVIVWHVAWNMRQNHATLRFQRYA